MIGLTVAGIYRDGKVELTERPEGIADGVPVHVVFPHEATQLALPPEDREALRQRAFGLMDKGLNLGGPPYPTREELYERPDGLVKRLNERDR